MESNLVTKLEMNFNPLVTTTTYGKGEEIKNAGIFKGYPYFVTYFRDRGIVNGYVVIKPHQFGYYDYEYNSNDKHSNGPEEYIECHGGITYDDFGKNKDRVIGLDTDHGGDLDKDDILMPDGKYAQDALTYEHRWTVPEVTEQCKYMIKQLIDLRKIAETKKHFIRKYSYDLKHQEEIIKPEKQYLAKFNHALKNSDKHSSDILNTIINSLINASLTLNDSHFKNITNYKHLSNKNLVEYNNVTNRITEIVKQLNANIKQINNNKKMLQTLGKNREKLIKKSRLSNIRRHVKNLNRHQQHLDVVKAIISMANRDNVHQLQKLRNHYDNVEDHIMRKYIDWINEP